MQKRTKIIHITYSLETGGAEMMMFDLLRGLDRHVFDASVCSFQPGGSLRSRFEGEGIAVHDVVKAQRKDYTLPWRLYRFFRDERVDIVHAHNGYMWLYSAIPAKLAGAKVVYTEHSVWEEPSRAFLTASGVSERITDCIVAPSEHVRILLAEKQGVNAGNVRVIRNGIDLARLTKKVDIELKRKELGLSPGEKAVGIIARLVPVKNHQVLIEAFDIVCSRMDNCRLLIVGDGELRSKLEEMVLRLGLNGRVTFLGNRNDVDEILQVLDLFVLCSISEGAPVSLLESMAAGVPVLATAVGGIPETLDQGRAGKLVFEQNPSGIARGITELLSDRRQSELYRETARRRVEEEFSLVGMAGKYSKMYDSVMEGHRKVRDR